MTGQPVEADEAFAAGLLNRLVPSDQVETTALELAELIAANPPAGTQAVKALHRRRSVGRTLETAHRAESSIMTTTLRPGSGRRALLRVPFGPTVTAPHSCPCLTSFREP